MCAIDCNEGNISNEIYVDIILNILMQLSIIKNIE